MTPGRCMPVRCPVRVPVPVPHSPCSFLNSFSLMKTGAMSSPTGGWMET